jgi:Nucleotidyl transferase AbiEii toxin, Type IV TA system
VSAFDRTLGRVGRDLDRLKVPWALIGGIAVSTRGAPRFTNDIDAAVVIADDGNRELLVTKLVSDGYRVEALLEDKDSGELNTVRLWCPSVSGTQFLLDVMFATTGIEAEAVAAAARVNVTPRIVLPVATVQHLIAMKVLSSGAPGRSRDEDDLQRMIENATSKELAEAQNALGLMTERGRNRGKNLEAEFQNYLKRFRPQD